MPDGMMVPRATLYITAKVSDHALFRRLGDNICVQVPIAVHEAALGAKIEVPTIDGPARLRIPGWDPVGPALSTPVARRPVAADRTAR